MKKLLDQYHRHDRQAEAPYALFFRFLYTKTENSKIFSHLENADVTLFPEAVSMTFSLLANSGIGCRLPSYVPVVSKNQHSFQLNQYSFPLDDILKIELSAPL